MHAIQAITAIHDSFLSDAPASPESIVQVSHHWSRASDLFHRRLSAPIQLDERDALWAAAAMFGIIAFVSFHAVEPEEAWPLKTPDSSDLDWLRMSDGKAAVWALTDPMRPDSIFHPIADVYSRDPTVDEADKSVSEKMPSAFMQLYDLHEGSTPNDNPYYVAVHTIVSLLPIKCDQTTILKFLTFIGHSLQPEYKRLLEQKDPRALLLLVYWYSKVCNASTWWLVRRAKVEGQAICLYLERYHPEESAVQALLQFPKMVLWGEGAESPTSTISHSTSTDSTTSSYIGLSTQYVN